MNTNPQFQNQTYEQVHDELGYKIYSEFLNFLHNFELTQDDPNFQAYVEGIEHEGHVKYYIIQAEKIKGEEKVTMFIDFTHLLQFKFNYEPFIQSVVNQFHKYEIYLRKAVTQFMSDLGHQYAKDKYFQVGFYNLPTINKIRDLKVMALGRMMSIHGTVTRTTEVKPELLLGSFKCKECGSISQNIEQQFKFTEPVRCVNDNCQNRTQWELINSDSVFLDWQKIRIQEHSGDIPAGSMPRSLDVILRGEIVDTAKPGDRTIFTGNLVVVPDIVQLLKPGEKPTSSTANTAKMKRNDQRPMDGITGLKKLGVKDLSYKLVFVANSVHAADSRFGFSNVNSAEDEEKQEDTMKQFTINERHMIMQMKDQDDLYLKLSKSIAPSVYSHLDVKKGILLQLFGGVHKSTQEGIKLRGDINICIVGDPSTAKSQFLKYICSFLPRAIYTSGKASSAAGLTASVLKDPETGEFCIEAGALMLADHGICCIDEFDKMDGKDQVAIHEAMEQQTISIAKAGIHATLNARSSILAAANPINGRYDRAKSLRYNVNISAPIMSRFDLFFVIYDEKRDDEDYMIAQHIVNMHRLKEDSLHPDFVTDQLQTYIKFCRLIKPKFNKESAAMLKEEFKRMRQHEKNAQRSAYKITVRQLESLIRLSEAMARAHCDQEIKANYVREVCRLMRNSNINIIKGDIEFHEIQEEINKERQLQRQMVGQQDQMEFASQQQNAEQQQQIAEQKKVKISFDEYKKLAFMITAIMKEFERKGEDNIQQKDIIESMIQKIEVEGNERQTSIEKTIETSKKIANVIQYLITNENILMISQDAKVKNDRYLTLNVNCDITTLAENLQGSREVIY